MVPESDGAGVVAVAVALLEADGISVGSRVGRPLVDDVDEGLTDVESVGFAVVVEPDVVGIVGRPVAVLEVVTVDVVVAVPVTVGVPVVVTVGDDVIELVGLVGLGDDELCDIRQAAYALRACWACFFRFCSVV